jgi:hypothetical protein
VPRIECSSVLVFVRELPRAPSSSQRDVRVLGYSSPARATQLMRTVSSCSASSSARDASRRLSCNSGIQRRSMLRRPCAVRIRLRSRVCWMRHVAAQRAPASSAWRYASTANAGALVFP